MFTPISGVNHHQDQRKLNMHQSYQPLFLPPLLSDLDSKQYFMMVYPMGLFTVHSFMICQLTIAGHCFGHCHFVLWRKSKKNIQFFYGNIIIDLGCFY